MALSFSGNSPSTPFTKGRLAVKLARIALDAVIKTVYGMDAALEPILDGVS